ncbi:acyl-CoA thioesterase/bile acid-CoA:amino acid N-acyltransferase family protein [Brenneria corticis]|uniref:Acyl-CoA thioester hydrolase n=1 Tax=Brenneria corticis TaxID=2173106 RepID=A0A2U1TN15_9GAMM|nr:acyl-CoA thioesterase/bile acid-CoA:amino acid N-acyltransferase family protein [Brenneria sp. CFCC 11842]PWC10786.1 acyl-CoA thioester hydrolase [Brenneria sp. CFCC 11842]
MSVVWDIDIIDGPTDQVREIRISGLAPGNARLSASLAHPDGSLWRSEATFSIAEDGLLDLNTAAPAAGDWRDAEPMAPIWALRQVASPAEPALSDAIQLLRIQLQVEDARGEIADATLVQRFLASGVTRRDVQAEGLSGALFIPPGDGPHPVAIVLSGSGGGAPEQRAALLAAHGYIGFALAYFRAPGRPDTISATPLEYFQQALDWSARELRPRAGFIAAVGHSRGGELALLLGATFPDRVSAVVGYVPSAVVHGTLRAGRPGEPRDAAAWTWRGRPLRNIWRNNPRADWHAFDHPPGPGAPIRQAPAFIAADRDAASVAAARIPVERIAGPVLLISGTDDGFWPSTDYSERIAADLSARRHDWPVEHVRNQGAGHAIGFPYVPTTAIAKVHPVAGIVIDGGGSPLANARANRHSWSRMLTFLSSAQAAHEART